MHLKLIESHLSQKTVRIGGSTNSSLKSIIIGVFQGSILGPLFLLIFINDLPNSNFMQILLSADDTALVESDYNLEKLWNDKSNGLAKCKQTLTKYFQNKIYFDHK